MSPHSLDDERDITLCEVLDRVLNKGVVLHGDVTISVADVDLIYLGLRLLLTSIETAATSGALPGNHRTLWRRNDGVN
jgi:hypothetical protein